MIADKLSGRPLAFLVAIGVAAFVTAHTFGSGVDEPPARISGKVTGVTDGDTFTITADEHTFKIRLDAADAPNAGQDFAFEARRALLKKIFQKTVSVSIAGNAKDDASFGRVRLDGESINVWAIANGFAWYYNGNTKSKTLERAEKKARDAKLGLWALEAPVPPWDWAKRVSKPALSQFKRRAIYREIMLAHSEMDRRMDAKDSYDLAEAEALDRHLVRAVATKHRLTAQELAAIEVEGITKGWFGELGKTRTAPPSASAALTWTEYLADCGLPAQKTNEAVTEKVFRDKYKGKRVSWTGVVDSVRETPLGSGYLVDVRMKPTESWLGDSDITLSASDSLETQVLALKKDDTVTFFGTFLRQGGTFLNHIIDLHTIKVAR